MAELLDLITPVQVKYYLSLADIGPTLITRSKLGNNAAYIQKTGDNYNIFLKKDSRWKFSEQKTLTEIKTWLSEVLPPK